MKFNILNFHKIKSSNFSPYFCSYLLFLSNFCPVFIFYFFMHILFMLLVCVVEKNILIHELGA